MTTCNYKSGPRFKAPRVVGTGLVALDVLLHDKNCTTDSALGGSTGNVLAILAFLGWSSVPVARLGRDSAGQQIKSEFAALNADTRFITQEIETETPVVYQWPGVGGKSHKFSFSCPFCGSKRSFVPGNDTEYCNHVLEQIDTADVFYFDRVTPWALVLAEAYRKRGALVMFEPSTIGADRAAFQRAIRSCNVLKYADERIEELGVFDRHTVDVEIQTAGVDGLRFALPSSSDREWHILDALPVSRIADTAGAGDWCTAGLLYYLSNKVQKRDLSVPSLTKALRYGQALAALNCMHPGARGLARQFEQHSMKNWIIQLLNEDLFDSVCSSRWTSAYKASQEFSMLGPVENRPRKSQCNSSKYSVRLCCEPLAR